MSELADGMTDPTCIVCGGKGLKPDGPLTIRCWSCNPASIAATKEVAFASLCVECGPNVLVDEDGLCAACGATCTGQWLHSHDIGRVQNQLDGAIDRGLALEQRCNLLTGVIRERVKAAKQKIHQAHHSGPIEPCRTGACDDLAAILEST